jgi:peptidoglycan/LPS O-acetylase OafA/YrhL
MGTAWLGYRPALDGLRAIAVSSVVLFHLTGYPARGWLGVDIFFVLSGFLITTLLLEERAAHGTVSLRGFYVRRARRLLPALFAFLALFVVVKATRGFTDRDLIGLAGGLGYCTNLFLSVGDLSQPATALTHLWSLSLEEQFYLVWPVVLLVVLRANRRAAVGLVSVVILVTSLEAARLTASGASGWRLGAAPDTRSVSLAVGCLAALAYGSGIFPRDLRFRYRLEPILFVFLLVVLVTVSFPQQWFSEGLLFVFACATSMLLLTVLDGETPLGRVLSLPPAVWLGKVSYSLYLWHLPVFVALGVFHGGGPSARADWWLRLTALGLSLILAACSYYFVERPFRRSRRRRELISNRKRAVTGVGGSSLAQPVGL